MIAATVLNTVQAKLSPNVLCAVALGLLGACSVEVAEDQADLCMQADAHLAECTDGEAHIPADCDEAAAQDVLDMSCAELGDPKADGFDDHLCALGIMRRCPVPACAPALPEDHDFADDDCTDFIELSGCAACDFYRCREAQSTGQCSTDGYYLGFGYKYCMRYAQVTESTMSPDGQVWSAATRRCLMDALNEDVQDSPACDSLIQAGYDTHPGCYADTGFCDLPASDWSRVWNTIDFKDQDFRLALSVGVDCLDGFVASSSGG